MKKRVLRILRLAPLALLFASVAVAQTTGTIIGVVTDASTGKPVAGALVIARSPAMQGEQTAVTDDAGNFRIQLLPPGQYSLAVQLEGYRPQERSDIGLRLDKTVRANLAVVPEAVQMEEQVVRTGIAPVINVGSAETGSVISREFVANIPVGRDFQAAAVVTPTARTDDFGVSFGGAQSPENNYVLDGLNVTDPAFGTIGTNLLTNFTQEIDVKTGSFMPEYGRATGGIINTITKSGSNEFHGSVFSSFTPRMWIQPKGEVTGRAGEAIQEQLTPDKGAYDLDFGFEVGGPILRDRLWFYGGFAPVIQRRWFDRFLNANELDAAGDRVTDAAGNFVQNKIPGSDTYYDRTQVTYQFVGKLTYLVNENHNVTLSGYGAPRNTQGYNANTFQTFNGTPSRFISEVDQGSYDVIGRYAGKFLSKRLVLEALTGYHTQYQTDQPTTVAGIDQEATPMTSYRFALPLSAFEDVSRFAECQTGDNACLVNRYQVGGYDFTQDISSERLSGRLSLSYLYSALGAHNSKVGVDVERNEYDDRRGYSGDLRFFALPGGEFLVHRAFGRVGDGLPGAAIPSTVAGDPALTPGVGYVPQRQIRSLAETQSFAAYAQDSWEVLRGLTLNYGLRWETQTMKDAQQPNSPRIDIRDNIGPRVQAVYDFTGTGRSKLAATWGRFYEMIPLDMGSRAFGTETQYQAVYQCGAAAPVGTPFDPRSNAACSIDPTGAGLVGDAFGNEAAVAQIGGITPVDPNLKGMYVDQFGAQAEYEIISDLSLGVEYQGRRLGRAIEDMSSNEGSTYFIANPGESDPWDSGFATIPANPREVDATDVATGRTVRARFPKAERDYDALIFKVTKNFSQNWLAQLSYTWSRLRGNYAGLYRPETLQLDPNLTSEYDLPTLMLNRKGLLPGDVPHTLKAFGSYTFNFGPRFNVSTGAAFTVQSGTPVNALASDPFYGPSEGFVLPRGMAGRTPTIYNVDLRGGVEYVIRAPYAVRFTVDLFNILNREDAIFLDEDYTDDEVQPVRNLECNSKNSVSKSNPIAAIQADCPDLAYLKTTDGRPVTVNENFGKPAAISNAFQAPFSMRVGLALSF